ncbi:MFS transporter [Streptomyces mashuensis]|uniref:MFS transporter n=1 Tax=Streptomyces mashuensis TaxID=33904 RepID=A0A919B6B7_9ACTN|nr:MFS transporter [Streptomyces mashuensis]GHF53172.1 MFS transporter [Streptomyces mashuensis]
MSGSTTAGGSLWRHPGFLRYWSANAVDLVGSGVTQVALPLVAVVELHASVWQVALLSFAQKLPPLLVSLPAGALADRHRKRPLMVGAALIGGAALLVIPLADALGQLSMGLLYGVALVSEVSAVFGATARISFLPSLLPRSRLLDANSVLGGVNSLADSVGSQLGGAMVTVLGAARSIYLDAASYLACSLLLARIGAAPEPAAAPSKKRWNTTIRAEIAEGLRYVRSHPTIRPLVLAATAYVGVMAFLTTLRSVYLLRQLHYSSTALGMTLSVAAFGGFCGAAVVRPVVARYGPRRVMLTTLALAPLTEVPLLLATPGRPWQTAVGLGLFVQVGCAVVQGSTQRTVRQAVCDPALQGRMLATSRWAVYGSQPVAALLAGAAGTWLGLWNGLAIGTLALAVPLLVLRCSSLPGASQGGAAPEEAHDHPEPGPEPEPVKESDAA